MEREPNNAPAGPCQTDEYRFAAKQLNTLLDALPVLIAYVDNERRYCFNNLIHQQWFGYSPSEISGMSMQQVLGEEAYETLRPYVERALQGERVSFELLAPFQRIGPRFVYASYIPDLEPNGRIRGFFSLISDISKIHHRPEHRIRRLKDATHTAHLNSMGELTSKIIHEVNQPLTIILTYAEACSALVRSGQYDLREVVASLDDIAKQAERAGAIIRKIRNLVDKHEVRFVKAEINTLVRETLHLMELDPNWRLTRFHLNSETSPLYARADPVMIEQVLLNLLHNALEAMEDLPPEQRQLILGIKQNTSGDIQITIDDTGPGIATDQLSRLFHPFTSGKPHGMGMGLTISRSIIRAHGGRLWFNTNPQGGASFSFTLPQYDEESAHTTH